MPPRTRIGLALCAALFALPLFFACRSTTAPASNDPEIQASSGHDAVEAMAMPEETIAQKRAKQEALIDVVWKISGPIIHQRWNTREYEFIPGNGAHVSTRTDYENVCMVSINPQTGAYRAILPRSQYPNLYRLFDTEKRLGRELNGGETDASDSPEREATEILEMPEDSIYEKETKRDFLEGTMWNIAEPIIRHRFETHDYEVIANADPYIPTAEDRENICMFFVSPEYGRRRVLLPRSQYPDLYRLFDARRRLDSELASSEAVVADPGAPR
jgi:hypothetical protein